MPPGRVGAQPRGEHPASGALDLPTCQPLALLGFWKILPRRELWTEVQLGSGLGLPRTVPGTGGHYMWPEGVTRFCGQLEPRVRLTCGAASYWDLGQGEGQRLGPGSSQ